MKVTNLQAALGSALLLCSAQLSSAELHGHRRAHQHYGRRNEHSHGHADHQLEERNASDKVAKRAVCSLPSHPDLVAVPGAQNGGWAMAPDRQCTAGTWCPIACVSGKVMAQWKPGTSYTYPDSMVCTLCSADRMEDWLTGMAT